MLTALTTYPHPVPRYRVNGQTLTKRELRALTTPTNIILQYFKTHRAFLKEVGKHVTFVAVEELVRHFLDFLFG